MYWNVFKRMKKIDWLYILQFQVSRDIFLLVIRSCRVPSVCKRTHNGALCESLCVHLRPRAHKRGNRRVQGQKGERWEESVSWLHSDVFLVRRRQRKNRRWWSFRRREDLFFSRFTMLYGVGLVASTNNCQLNVRRIDLVLVANCEKAMDVLPSRNSQILLPFSLIFNILSVRDILASTFLWCIDLYFSYKI